MSGVDLGRRLTQRHPDVKVLHMSGYMDTEGVRKDALNAGGDFLPKPFTPDALLAKVRAMLAL